MLKENNKNTKKKCEIFQKDNYSEENVCGELHEGQFS